MTGFGSFDNSMRVAVVELEVNNGSGTGSTTARNLLCGKKFDVKLFWYRGTNGYSEADGYGNSMIWRQMRSGQKKRGVHQI